jgi:hypothetical protein
VQCTDKDRAFDHKLERVVLEQICQHIRDPEPFPHPAEQQQSTDSASMKSKAWNDKARFTVQVGFDGLKVGAKEGWSWAFR